MKAGIRPPPFSQAEILERAGRLIDQYCAIVGRSELFRWGLHFDDVFEQAIYPLYGIQLDESRDLGTDPQTGKKTLGEFLPEENIAFIDRSLKDDPRRIFTLWHEVAGHGVLQGQWLRDQLRKLRVRHRRIVTTEDSLSPAAIDMLERQANLFASHAAAPEWLLHAVIVKVFRPTKLFVYIQPCTYWLEVHGRKCRYFVDSVDHLCALIAWKIQPHFGGLSKEALGYRIKESGWIADRSSVSSFRLFRSASVPTPPPPVRAAVPALCPT
jgi:hypothetical protein